MEYHKYIRLFLQITTFFRIGSATDVQAKFQESGLVPDILDTAPNETIQVSYPSGVSPNLGNELTPLQVKDEPTVHWNTRKGELYTFHMTDPDVPSRQNRTNGPLNHWLVVNIPAGGDIRSGRTITEYAGSHPRPNSGLHRYAFMTFRQPGRIKVSSSEVPENRYKFPIRDFAKRHNLGNPIAGNFYLAQYDDYVATVTNYTRENV